jgi:hypothetical protein
MTDALRKLVCCMFLLALAGSASAGFGTIVRADTGKPVAGSHHGDMPLITFSGQTGRVNTGLAGCYFPIWNIPAYYVCIMVCKIGGGGDACAPGCEAELIICP